MSEYSKVPQRRPVLRLHRAARTPLGRANSLAGARRLAGLLAGLILLAACRDTTPPVATRPTPPPVAKRLAPTPVVTRLTPPLQPSSGTAEPPSPAPHSRLGQMVEADVYRVTAPSALIHGPVKVEEGQRLGFAYAAGQRGGPGARAVFRLSARDRESGDSHPLLEDSLDNVGSRSRIPVVSVTASGNGQTQFLVDGDWTGTSWTGASASGDVVELRFEKPHPITAIAVAGGAVGDGGAGVPTLYTVELSDGAGTESRLRIAHRPTLDYQWHRLPGSLADRITLRIEETNDGAPVSIREILVSSDPDYAALPDQLGTWHDAVVDLARFRGRQIELVFELADVRCNDENASCQQEFLLRHPTVLQPRPQEVRNAILISIDTVRADRLAAYGHARPTSPFLDSLRQRPGSFWLTNSRSASTWTTPSHMSLFTGLMPWQHRLHISSDRLQSWLQDKAEILPLDSRIATLTEILRDHGYATVALSSHGPLKGELGFQRGFDSYADLADLVPNDPLDYEGELVSKAELTTGWLERLKDHPFFLFLHTFAAHHPYHRSDLADCATGDRPRECDAYMRRIWPADNWLRHSHPPREERIPANFPFFGELYDSNLLEADRFVRHVVEELRRLGLDRSTVVAITSDHGESFGEHLPYGIDAHGLGFYDEMIRVPLLFLFPDDKPAIRSDVAVSSIDVMPTLLESLEIEPPAGLDGRSLLPLRRGEPAPARDRMLHYQVLATEVAEDHHFVAASRDQMKILANPYNLRDGKHELFNLADDPGETRNLAAEQPELCNEMLGEIEKEIRRSLRGMIVIELAAYGRPALLRATASLDRPARLFDLATRKQSEVLKADGEGLYRIELSLHEERRLIGLEPASRDFLLTLDLTQLPDDCDLRFGPDRQPLTSRQASFRAVDLALTAADWSGGGRAPCALWVYFDERATPMSAPLSEVDDERMSDEDVGAVIEQMRALGYMVEEEEEEKR